METVVSAFALAETAGQCIKLGKKLTAYYRAYKHAGTRVGELLLRVEGIELKTEVQIGALTDISKALSDRLLSFLDECLRKLVMKLSAAMADIEKIIKTSRPLLTLAEGSTAEGHDPHLVPRQRLRFSIVESHLRKTINELESWHAIFDPTWLLITLPQDKRIDDGLSRRDRRTPELDSLKAIRNVLQRQRPAPGTVFRDASFVQRDRKTLQFSSLVLTTHAESGSAVLLDTTSYDPACDKNTIKADVRDLARILASSDCSTLGLLPCLGVISVPSIEPQLQLVYGLDSGWQNPRVLRSCLVGSAPDLDDKFRIAKCLARSVTAVHSAGFVHKSIRPETVLIIDKADRPYKAAVLVGFERFRTARGSTMLSSDMIWERNLYRHPTRQGQNPEDIVPYVMQHDIYSLGVCLLELGMWTCFVDGENDPKPSAALDVSHLLEMDNKTRAAWDIKAVLVSMAKDRLPQLMGRSFAQLVVSCLACLDTGTDNMFGDEKDLWDEDGVLVGVAFIEKILVSLEAISLGTHLP